MRMAQNPPTIPIIAVNLAARVRGFVTAQTNNIKLARKSLFWDYGKTRFH